MEQTEEKLEKTEAKAFEPEENRSNPLNYLIGSKLGYGTYGSVFAALFVPKKQVVAIKILNPTYNVKSLFEKEVKNLLQVQGIPQCVQIFSSFSDHKKKFWIAMEYCKGGAYLDYIMQKKGLSKQIVQKHLHEIVLILEELQSHNICHLDIKADNFLLDKNLNLILGDFGMAFHLNEPNQIIKQYNVGSKSYRLPELIYCQPYRSFQADIFASGVTIFAAYSCLLPFQDNQTYSILFHNPESFWNEMKNNSKNLDFKDNLSKDFIDLFTRMVHIDASKRITLDEIKNHPFYLGVDIKDIAKTNVSSQIEELNYSNDVKIEENEEGGQTRGANSESISTEFYKYEYSISNLNNERIAKVFNVRWERYTDFKTNIDPSILFQYLVVKQEHFTTEIPVLSDKSFKIKCFFEQKLENQEENNELQPLKFDINLKVGDENMLTYVFFTKKQGDSFEFFQLCSQIKKIIKKFK